MADKQHTLPTRTLRAPRRRVCPWELAALGGGQGGHSRGRGSPRPWGWSPCPMTQLPECYCHGRGQEAQGPRELMLSPAGPETSAEHCHVQLCGCVMKSHSTRQVKTTRRRKALQFARTQVPGPEPRPSDSSDQDAPPQTRLRQALHRPGSQPTTCWVPAT